MSKKRNQPVSGTPTAAKLPAQIERGRRIEDLDMDSDEWKLRRATLSHKTAQEEFGLTWEEIVQAIRFGKLQYREGSMCGNPWLRLLRREVECLVKEKRGDDYFKKRQAKTELAKINNELKRLKAHMAVLEQRKSH